MPPARSARSGRATRPARIGASRIRPRSRARDSEPRSRRRGNRCTSGSETSWRRRTLTEPASLPRRLAAEGVGAFFLFATVIGSGIMAEHLSGGNDAIALLGNTVATGAILFVLITMLGPVSGAHMNPAVSLVAALRRELPWRDAAAYLLVQLAFGILGAW